MCYFFCSQNWFHSWEHGSEIMLLLSCCCRSCPESQQLVFSCLLAYKMVFQLLTALGRSECRGPKFCGVRGWGIALFLFLIMRFQWRSTLSVYKIALEKYKEYRYYETKQTPVTRHYVMRREQSDLQVMKTRIKRSLHSLAKLGCSYMKRSINWIFSPQRVSKMTRVNLRLAVSVSLGSYPWAALPWSVQ